VEVKTKVRKNKVFIGRSRKQPAKIAKTGAKPWTGAKPHGVY
jgi:hypothetical protein